MDYAKKIMYQSNYWYNDGLKKAQERDMNGAIIALRQSLQYNRENIAARNLAGLVYYGMRGSGRALVEWIISKNMKPRDNIADPTYGMFRTLRMNWRVLIRRSKSIINVSGIVSRTEKIWRRSS